MNSLNFPQNNFSKFIETIQSYKIAFRTF